MEKLKVQLPSPVNTPNSQSEELVYETCPDCKGEWPRLEESGFCPNCDAHRRIVAKDKAHREMVIKACLGKKGLLEFSLKTYRQAPGNMEAFKACEAFNPLSSNLYLYGGCGTGKTHLAGATWRKRVEEGAKCEFIKHPELNRLFRKKEADEERALLKKFLEYEILVIDDLGVGKSTEFANTVLYEIIDMRASDYKNGMILTSNLSLDEFAAKVGDDRLPSRIAGLCKVIKMVGSDFRFGQK